MKRLVTIAPCVFAVVIGASALVMSPVSCGCEDMPMNFAAAAGLPHRKAHQYTAAEFQSGFEQNLIGRKRTPHELFAPGLSWCDHVTSASATCFVAFSESWLVERGMEVTFATRADGAITGAKVRPTWRLALRAAASRPG